MRREKVSAFSLFIDEFKKGAFLAILGTLH
jgi:hypothetical protein